MFKQAVQTLTGRGGDPDVVADDVYELGNDRFDPQTDPAQDAPTDGQNANPQLQATVDRLSARLDNYETRNADKDRHIGQLEGELRQFRAARPEAAAGGVPEAPAPDPVLDETTATLFAEKYKDNPEQALMALAEHVDNRAAARTETAMSERDRAQDYQSTMQAIEQNILRQVDAALTTYGEAAADLVGDFVGLVRRGNASANDYAQTWLGQELGQDQGMAQTSNGVYRLIEAEALKRGITAQSETTEPTYTPAPTAVPGGGVSRPSAPSRNVELPSDGSHEIPIEDQIGDAIVASAGGDDAQIRTLFQG